MKDDSFTLARAEVLARKIERFWRKQGHKVHAWVEPVPLKGLRIDEPIFQVRSDLINGLPAKVELRAAA